MGIMNGFGLTGRLIAKHFGKIGNDMAAGIAAFDPETATEADRDRLSQSLRNTSRKLAEARMSYNKEQADVDALLKLIDGDSAIAKTLGEKLVNGEVTEAAVNTFLDELEANKKRLPSEQKEAVDAKEYLDQMEALVAQISEQLIEFDEKAKKAIREINQAKADLSLQELKHQRQEELTGLKSGLSSSSTALSALAKKAQNLNADAEASRIVTSVGDRQADRNASVESIRSGALSVKPSAADRLKALSQVSD